MIFIAATLSLHFLIYAIFLRKNPFFYKERNIFLYQALSFAAHVVVSSFLAAAGRVSWSFVAASAALHGIYSLSFLEMWALSDGGYSLRILDQINRQGTFADFKSLETLGASKKQYRLDSLKRLGFLRADPEGLALTPRGRAAAAFLNFFVNLSKQKGYT